MLGVPSQRIQHLCLNDRIPYFREPGRRNSRYLIRRRDAEALRVRLRQGKTSAGDGD